jgi:hypothetical protein
MYSTSTHTATCLRLAASSHIDQGPFVLFPPKTLGHLIASPPRFPVMIEVFNSHCRH